MRHHALVLVLLATVFVPTSASADCAAPTLELSPPAAAPGDEVQVTGNHWMAECNDTCGGCGTCGKSAPARVQIWIGPDHVVTVDAREDYRLETTFVVPELPADLYRVLAYQRYPWDGIDAHFRILGG